MDRGKSLEHRTLEDIVTNQNLDPNELKSLNAKELLNEFECAVRSERKITHVILKYVREVNRRKLYLDYGYESLYKFMTQHMRYSGDQAYARMNAAIAFEAKPEVEEKIQQGRITLSQLQKVGQCLKQEASAGKSVSTEQTNAIFEQIENKSVFETEQVLASELGFEITNYQKLRPQKDGSVIVEITFSAEQFELLKKAQSLISHSVPNNDIAEAITYLAKLAIKKFEGAGAVKAKETLSEISTQSFRETQKSFAKHRRRYISLKTRRKLLNKADKACSHVDPASKRKCHSRFQLQVDHIVPLARGGSNNIENLRILCGLHNRTEAERCGLKRPV